MVCTGQEIGIHPKYSLLLYHVNAPSSDTYRFIHSLLQKGIKVFWFSPVRYDGLQPLQPFLDARLLQFYVCMEKGFGFPEHVVICDGKGITQEQLFKLHRVAPGFNYQQYSIEHSDGKKHTLVEAGAGTGKTTVMVQRAMYLMHHEEVALDSMAMVTFTNEAARNMRQKIYEELFARYRVTGLDFYLKNIELLPNMIISTIDSFAKFLIQETGASAGYGRDVSVRNFALERKRIIERYLDSYFAHGVAAGKNVSALLNGLRHYEIVRLIEKFWNRMEQLGMTLGDITRLDWGTAHDGASGFEGLFSAIFPSIEKEFQDYKVLSNAVSLGDITRQMEVLSGQPGRLQQLERPLTHVFIDEFQDTDDTQIKLAYRLFRSLNTILFIVGDVKQSIYRFRGADYTAFKQLGGLLGDPTAIKQYTMTRNYRTKASLLKHVEGIFSRWGKEGWLTYGEEDRLIGDSSMPSEKEWRMEIIRPNMVETKFCTWLGEALELAGASGEVALLVRTNRQARQLQLWCEKHYPNMPLRLDIGGSFFISDAVHDFVSLLRALLYPAEPQHLYTFLNSSYSNGCVHWSSIAGLNGDIEALLNVLRPCLPGNWQDYLDALRLEPVLAVIRSVVKDLAPAKHYYTRHYHNLLSTGVSSTEAEKVAKMAALQYQENLDFLFDLIHEKFSGDYVTLYRLERWLTLAQRTDRNVDEPAPGELDGESRIRITTVHKAKGLEFDTVIIPFTGHGFRYHVSELLIARPENEKDPAQAGWQIAKGGRCFENDYYQKLSKIEEEEIIKEETRLLYVAMTRAKNRLWVMLATKRGNTWSSLLQGGGNDGR